MAEREGKRVKTNLDGEAVYETPRPSQEDIEAAERADWEVIERFKKNPGIFNEPEK